MVTLLVGVLLVAGGAAGFGVALFGRRPVPQPAMAAPAAHLGGGTAELLPSAADADAGGVLQVGRWRRLLQREPTADHQPAADVTLSGGVRARSALYLTLVVTGLAALIGIVSSIVVVGLVLLVT
jgi:hypothetical protein